MGNDRHQAILPAVMVIAYRDEPVRLSVLRQIGSYLIVVGRDRTQQIGFPVDRSYVYNKRQFRAL